MSQTIVLISGANRGLGKELLRLYLAKPNHIVIAANRDPSSSTSKALSELPVAVDSRLVVVKVDALSETDAIAAVKEPKSHGINHIDIVIANAGVFYTMPKVSEVKIEELQAHIVPNVYGVVWLYQATLPLLLKSENPKWVTMGSMAGSLHAPPPIPNAAYGTSKAAVHWLTKRIDAEEAKITAFIITPGLVQTDMGNAGARLFGLEGAPLTIEESCSPMLELIEKAKKDTHGGRLWFYLGEEMPL